ncbi:Iron Transport-associated domain-containing protein [Sporobacter termitidis DSM 10068]|uniref:Iron Transport-associated domain-containing protein n=1 Tax=Sporobacter termitidis DSM 10068 TaxID=1123282 RepID=A0A1M5WLE1_9FIRM|nr:MarR family transcriptional regulator [Sporobacter termitidis]SHH88336.1 Iron Transport-associated domain-containing protein [Sporobacter termitidis DSM 10068]
MNLTPKQLQYLFYIDHFKNSGRLISDLAEQLGVTKGAVSQVLDIHEKHGLIRRRADGRVVLTAEAEQAIAELKEKHRFICPFFRTMPNLDDALAVKCALQYVCWMPRESVDGLVQNLAERERFNCLRWDMEEKAPDMDFPFPDGSYQVPFDVYRADSNVLSMGDKGFVKPARMDVMDGRGTITLKSKEIRYRSGPEKYFRGKLTRLSCLCGSDFVQIRSKNSEYTIPLHYIRKLSLTPGGTLCATLRIKAEASRCVSNMPISEADIMFRFV